MAAASAAQKGSKVERQLAELDESGAQKGKNSTACKSGERGQMLGRERKTRNSTSARSFWKAMEFNEFLLRKQRSAGPASVGGGTV